MDQHVNSSRAQFDAFKVLPRDAPVAMLNLVRFREQASYPADHPLATAGLSGAAAYGQYSVKSEATFQRVGGSILWSGLPEVMLIGPIDERWDAAFVATYPTAAAFLAMVSDPEYQLAVVHRQAAVATSRLIRTAPQAAGQSFG